MDNYGNYTKWDFTNYDVGSTATLEHGGTGGSYDGKHETVSPTPSGKWYSFNLP